MWGEDHLLPRLPDGKGFMKGVMGPGGAIYNVATGRQAMGVVQRRVPQPVRRGLQQEPATSFTYDADMEWDFNTPWYPAHAGVMCRRSAEYGWRNAPARE